MTLIELLAILTEHNIEMQVVHLRDLMSIRITMTCMDTDGRRSAASMVLDIEKLTFLGFENHINQSVKEILDRMVEYSQEIEAAREDENRHIKKPA